MVQSQKPFLSFLILISDKYSSEIRKTKKSTCKYFIQIEKEAVNNTIKKENEWSKNIMGMVTDMKSNDYLHR